MNFFILLPLAVVLSGIAAAWFLPRYMTPSLGVQVMTAGVLLAAVATIAAMVQIAAAGLSVIPVVADVLGWCRALYGGQHGVSPLFGSIALIVLVGGVVGAVRYVIRVRRASLEFASVDGVEIVDVDGPIAFAVPGRPGGVVIGRQLLETLDRRESTAVLAHENAHLRHHHHRYVRIVETSAAAFPFLRPFSRQVRFLTERWADEVAARLVGSREVVAMAIARVALMAPSGYSSYVLGFSGSGAARRAEALMAPEPSRMPRVVMAAGVLVTVITFGSGVQVHHLLDFLAHVCGI